MLRDMETGPKLVMLSYIPIIQRLVELCYHSKKSDSSTKPDLYLNHSTGCLTASQNIDDISITILTFHAFSNYINATT